ncbi:MAG TPA: NAD(P)-dependent alcohol dehydrogenase, partial [Dermatophilaceae bacterium]|nr:NAD(P)-dependent alcohol dehydrogenase [Dermatophilaceae bacterium]
MSGARSAVGQPGAGDVLVRVHATTVCRTDCGQLRARPFFMRLITGVARPKRTILGMDFAPGDRVFGLTPGGYGGHAEYLCLSQAEAFTLMPEGMDFHEAVVCEGAWYANSNLQTLGVRSGHRILIYGASGAIGTAAVQLATFYGAEVTAVVATRHLDLARSLGADHVVDYTREDFTKIDETFDFVLDAVGKASYFQCRRLLTPQGVFATTDLGPHNQ